MIGNPNWFEVRKYGGWGLKPRAWQGWLYMYGLIAPIIAFQVIPNWTINTRITITTLWLLLVALEVADIMIRLKKDERELLHEALAERNVAWFITLFLTLGLLYQAIASTFTERISCDPVIVIALFGGALIKGLSYWYLKDK